MKTRGETIENFRLVCRLFRCRVHEFDSFRIGPLADQAAQMHLVGQPLLSCLFLQLEILLGGFLGSLKTLANLGRQRETPTSADRRTVKGAASLPMSPSIQAVRSRPSMVHDRMRILLLLALASNASSPKISYHLI